MFPGSTLLLDVGTQRDLWPDGAWPLLEGEAAARVQKLCALGARGDIRVGGLRCVHSGRVPGVPEHCLAGTPGAERVAACVLPRPVRLVRPDSVEPLARSHATYLASGCDRPIAGAGAFVRGFDHLVAGIRNAVVFGAGIEGGIAHAVAALLDRRVPTHLVIDASSAVDEVRAQQLIGRWKRAGVDVLTTDTVVRSLTRGRN